MSVITSASIRSFPDSLQSYKKVTRDTSLSNYAGQILILGSSFSTIAVLVCCVVVSPWFAPLLIGVVAMAILGVKLIEKEPDPAYTAKKNQKLQIQKVIQHPKRRKVPSDPKPGRVVVDSLSPVPTIESSQFKPVGLNNPSNNCWANSMLQFLMNIPAYREAILSKGPTTQLKTNMQRYLRAQSGQEAVAQRVNTQEIRSFLSQKTHIRKSQSRQEDVSEALEYIFDEAGLYNDLSEAYLGDRFHGVPRGSPFVGLSLANCGENAPFETQMNRYFNFFTDDVRRLRKFTGKAPADFVVKQERFYRQDIEGSTEFVEGKHLQKIDIPIRYQLSPDYTTEETEPTDYECDAFITHIGRTIYSGHYVAFLKKQDSSGRVTYWKCNDQNISRISQDAFVAEMKTAYFLHFKKV